MEILSVPQQYKVYWKRGWRIMFSKYVRFEFLELVDVTLFGKRIFTDVIQLRILI